MGNTRSRAWSARRTAIRGAGATFPYPIYAQWSGAYQKESGVGLNYQSIGSGGGEKQIRARTVTFGASDRPLSGAELTKKVLAQSPTVLGGVVAAVNLDGVGPGDLTLDGLTAAEIFLGKIKKWDDPAIARLNPSLKLPPIDIVTSIAAMDRAQRLFGHPIGERR
jgi:phosphate transport system substrate-binding protein